jgi:hypothetical protein
MHALSDHYVTLDFTGWRYVELLVRERDVERMTDHVWPYGGTYDIYRNPLDLAHISEVNVYLNDLPANDATEVVLGPVIALPVQPAELTNPRLTLNGRTLTVPVTLKSGDFLELDASGVCTHYDERGNLQVRLQPVAAEAWPVLRAGENPIEFGGEKPQGASARAEVTVNSFGAPFGAPNPSGEIGWKHLGRECEMTRLITAPDGEDNAWDMPVRPGGRAKLELELCGVMDAPVLTVGGRTARFPVTLKEGHRLLCRDRRRWTVLDASRTKIAEGELPEELPVLPSGRNRVSFSCAAPVRGQVRLVKVYE